MILEFGFWKQMQMPDPKQEKTKRTKRRVGDLKTTDLDMPRGIMTGSVDIPFQASGNISA